MIILNVVSLIMARGGKTLWVPCILGLVLAGMSTIGGLRRRSYYYGGMVSSAELSLFGFIPLEIIFDVAIYVV